MEPETKTQGDREYVVKIDGVPQVIQRAESALHAATDVIVSQLGPQGEFAKCHIEHDLLNMRIGNHRIEARPYPVSLFPSSEVYNVKGVPA